VQEGFYWRPGERRFKYQPGFSLRLAAGNRHGFFRNRNDLTVCRADLQQSPAHAL
jgi:hypothetical protein